MLRHEDCAEGSFAKLAKDLVLAQALIEETLQLKNGFEKVNSGLLCGEVNYRTHNTTVFKVLNELQSRA